jgi:flagellar biosynthetic protein FlhB
VPLVVDVPLTRALHAACGLGEEIPVDLYTPVARVLTFVMALKARGTLKGTHTPPRVTTADEVAGVLAPESLEADAVPRRLRIAREAASTATGTATGATSAPSRPAPPALSRSVRPATSGGTR